MNVYETKQIYHSMLYKTYIDYDIARRNYIWRLFEIIIKWRRLMFVLFLLDSSRHLCSFGKWKKCKNTCDIYLELFLHSLYGCQGFFGLSYIKESGKRHYPDGKNDKNCTVITSHQWSMISKKKCCVYKARTHSLTTFGPQGFDKIVYFILFFNLKQFSLGGVIYPAEFVF